MITLPLGFIFVASVLIYALQQSNAEAIINIHSIVIVVAGSFAILFVSTPLRNVLGLIRAIWDLRKSEVSNKIIKSSVLELAKAKTVQQNNFTHPLITYAQELWVQGLDEMMVEVLLTQKIEELNTRTEQPVTALKNLAKYPPALGMTGTVIGMIELFINLSAENKAKIGPSLALAMTATFYGLAMANFLIMPLADRLHVRHMSRVKRNELVFQSLLLINKNEPESILENVYRENGRARAAV